MSREGQRLFPGYGRGWGEEKASGFWPRVSQRMREPATTDDWIWAIAFFLVCFAALPWVAAFFFVR